MPRDTFVSYVIVQDTNVQYTIVVEANEKSINLISKLTQKLSLIY